MDVPLSPETPASAPNSPGERAPDTAIAAAMHDAGTTNDKPRQRRRRKGTTEAPMKTIQDIALQARHDVIGTGLKQIFDEIVEEPIPQEFLALLEQIDLKREP